MWQAYLHNHKGAERISDHQLKPNNQTRATRAVRGWSPAAQLPEQLCGSSYRQTGRVTAYRDMGLIIGKEHLGIVQDSFWGVGDKPKTRRRRDWGSVGNKHGKTEVGACVYVCIRTNNWNGLRVSAVWVTVPATGAVQWPAPGQTEAVCVYTLRVAPGPLGMPAQPPVCLDLGTWSCSSLASVTPLWMTRSSMSYL